MKEMGMTKETEILFIEGVSGVGKSTMVDTLEAALIDRGFTVKCYKEFDFTNPIDFYCTAYLTNDAYDRLCARYPEQNDALKRYSIPAGKAALVRYYDNDTPLFPAPLLSELAEAEFCYDPKHPVPLADYTEAYREVWTRFAAAPDPAVDHYIFDGSLLHHPINDMMRNYRVSPAQAAAHVKTLLDALGSAKRRVIYLYTDDLPAQLRLARKNRGENPPTDGDISFWEERYRNDVYVVDALMPDCRKYNVSHNGWDCASDDILACLQ